MEHENVLKVKILEKELKRIHRTWCAAFQAFKEYVSSMRKTRSVEMMIHHILFRRLDYEIFQTLNS